MNSLAVSLLFAQLHSQPAEPGPGPLQAAPVVVPDVAAEPTPGVPAGARSLLRQFAAMQGLAARFSERKVMTLLAAPMVNEGIVIFRQTRRGPELARHLLEPHASSVVIRRGQLRFGDARGRETIELARNPVVSTFVDSFVLVLAGDEAGLRRIYELDFSQQRVSAGVTRWTLRLTPKSAVLARVVESLEVSGVGPHIESMVMKEVGGDQTITTFSASQIDPKLSVGEARSLFSLQPRAAHLRSVVAKRHSTRQ